MPQSKDPNQGEGDRKAARRYDHRAREFVADGKVEGAAEVARDYVEREPDDAARAERRAHRGPGGRWLSVDELVSKGHSLLERMRARFGRK